MINLDEESLICDLAETYQIYDYKRLPLQTVAVFSCGLRENSRIKMKLSQQTASIETMLLAGISDKLGILLWAQTKDGQKGKNRPISILEKVLNLTKKRKEEVAFASAEEFESTAELLPAKREKYIEDFKNKKIWCPYCGNEYTRFHNLNRHLTKHHTSSDGQFHRDGLNVKGKGFMDTYPTYEINKATRFFSDLRNEFDKGKKPPNIPKVQEKATIEQQKNKKIKKLDTMSNFLD